LAQGRSEIYFVNFTEWGPSATARVTMILEGCRPLVVMAVEHNVAKGKLAPWRSVWSKAGYMSSVTPARLTGRGGTHGGCMVAVRGDQVSYEGPVLAMLGSRAGPEFEADQWTARGFRAPCLDILLIAVYMDDGVGFLKQNLARAEQISVVVEALKGQWIIVGDWEVEPDTFGQTDWPKLLGGELQLPVAVCSCSAGRGPVIDFGMAERLLLRSPGSEDPMEPTRPAPFQFAQQAADEGLSRSFAVSSRAGEYWALDIAGENVEEERYHGRCRQPKFELAPLVCPKS
jgi:hypothetical protein